MKVLSFDPGFDNFAWCITNYRCNPVTNNIEFKIKECGHLQNTITQLSDYVLLKEHYSAFITEITLLLNEVDCVAIERFQSRGVKSGLTQECVTMMIGVMIKIAYDKDKSVHMVTPATWKNRFNEYSNLKLAYSLCWATPHVLDSFLIGYHYFAVRSYVKKPFKYFEIEANRDKTLFKLEECAPTLSKRRKARMFFTRE